MPSNTRHHSYVRAELEIVKMPRDSLAYPSLIPSCKDLDKVYRQIRKLLNYDHIRRREKVLKIVKKNINVVNQRPKSSACIWTRITEASFGKECELSVDLSSVAEKCITFESNYEPCEGKEGLFVNVVV